jgi:2-dehydro-3-deoxyglucarate aldolase/4-hydroxy-2-oxoheptanedioate aldolase
VVALQSTPRSSREPRFDWLIVDLEHGAGTESELMGQLHGIGDTTTAIVRPQSAERLRIGRALDAGAAGIMVRRLEIADEVRETLPYLRYPPEEVRGLALATRGAGLERSVARRCDGHT